MVFLIHISLFVDTRVLVRRFFRFAIFHQVSLGKIIVVINWLVGLDLLLVDVVDESSMFVRTLLFSE